jgi:hypothetical protein
MANLTGTLKPPSPTMAANASQDEIDEAIINQPISAPPENDIELVESGPPSNRAKAPIGGGNLLTSLIRLVKTSSKAFMKKRATRRKGRKGRKAKGKGTK